MALVVNLYQHRRILVASPTFHPLRHAFLNPRRRSSVRFLLYEAVRQLVPQHPRQFGIHSRQPLHWHADSSIIQRAHPSRRLRDVRKSLLRVEHHPNRLRRRVTQLGLNLHVMLFECMQDFPGQFRFCRSVIFQLEMRALVFLIVLLLRFISLSLVECRAGIRIRMQRHRLLPVRDRLLRAVHSVVGPAFQLVYARVVGRHPFRPLQIIHGLLEFALL